MASKLIYPAVAVVGIALASGGAWWYQSKPKGPQEVAGASSGPQSGAAAPAPGAPASAARAAGVEIAKVEKQSLQDDAQAVGTLRSRQSVMLRPEVAGRVKLLGFADGARVRKGQVLVQLDDVLQRAEIKQAQAQVSIAQANLKRNQELVAQSFVAQRVVDESAANLQVVEAQLSLACARWSRMTVIAPFDGTVGLRVVNVGDYVKDGADLVNLEDLSSMYVDFRLPERFLGKIRLQQPVEMTLDAFAGRAFKARIEAIDPLLDANGRSVGVRAVLPNNMGDPAREGGGRGGPSGAGRPGAQGGANSANPSGKPAAPQALPSAKPTTSQPTPSASKSVGGGRPSSASAGPPGGAASASSNRPGRAAPDANPCPVEAVPAQASAGSSPVRGAARPMQAGGGNPAPLRPGMFARVNTVFSVNEGALVLPEEAIVPQAGRQFVIKVVEPEEVPSVVKANLPPDTKFVSLRQEVKLGVRRQGKVEVTEGVTEGQTVVLAGQQRLQRDGTPLRIVELGRPPQGAASSSALGQATGLSTSQAPNPSASSPTSSLPVTSANVLPGASASPATVLPASR